MHKPLFKLMQTRVVLDANAPIHHAGRLTETFGIRAHDGRVAPFASRGEAYPCEGSFSFSAAEDNQDQITLSFFRGTQTDASSCKFLGEIRLSGFHLGPAQTPLARLYFSLANDRIEIWALDEKDGHEIPVSVARNAQGALVH